MNNNSRDAKGARRRRFGWLFAPVFHVQRTLAAGILVILPIGITWLVLQFFFDQLNPILQPYTDLLPGRHFPGLGLAALIVLVYVVGLVAAFVLGRRLIRLAHQVMELIPLVKSIYGPTRAAVDILSTTDNHRYSGVVLIDFPRTGLKSIGLITATMTDANGEELLAVYIPTVPVPSTGFLVIAPVAEVTLTDISVEEAISIVISGGVRSSGVFDRFRVVSQRNPGSNPSSNH